MTRCVHERDSKCKIYDVLFGFWGLRPQTPSTSPDLSPGNATDFITCSLFATENKRLCPRQIHVGRSQLTYSPEVWKARWKSTYPEIIYPSADSHQA